MFISTVALLSLLAAAPDVLPIGLGGTVLPAGLGGTVLSIYESGWQ